MTRKELLENVAKEQREELSDSEIIDDVLDAVAGGTSNSGVLCTKCGGTYRLIPTLPNNHKTGFSIQSQRCEKCGEPCAKRF